MVGIGSPLLQSQITLQESFMEISFPFPGHGQHKGQAFREVDGAGLYSPEACRPLRQVEITAAQVHHRLLWAAGETKVNQIWCLPEGVLSGSWGDEKTHKCL